MDALVDSLKEARSCSGRSLYEMSVESAVLVAMLRDFGCTFCRETVSELARLRRPFEQNGVRIALVHMGTPEEGEAFFAEREISGVEHFSDPERVLYEALELREGSFSQLYGLGMVTRLIPAFLRHGVGPRPNPRQMSGIFLIRDGKIERYFRPRVQWERPDYLYLADCEMCDTESAVSAGSRAADE